MEFLESVFLTGFFGRFFLEGFFGRIFWKDFSGKVGFFSEGVCAVHGLFFGEGGVFSVFFDWLFLRSVSMAMHCIPANDSYFVVFFFPFFFLSFLLLFQTAEERGPRARRTREGWACTLAEVAAEI